MADVNSSIDYEDKIISDEVRRKMDAAVKKAEEEGVEIESEYYTGSDLDKMKELARLNDIGVITGPFADFGRGVNIPRTPTLFNLFAMEEELSHNREPEGPDINEGKFKANPARALKNIKGHYDEEKRAKKEALQRTGGLLPKGQRTVELTKNTYAEMFKDAIDRYVKKTGDIETKKVLLNDYPELKNVKKVIYPEGDLPFNKGGAVPMEKQMDMFEDGGLLQEGGTVDPESGNEVPVGSTQEEVRDDIPAQLSEGEFVFPADVVRYWGLEKLMEMRQQAKAGLQRMEDMGQMGNSEEATLPDDIPFDINDLDIEDEPEYNMAVGGFIQPQAGYGTTVMQPTQPMMQPSMFANYAQQPATQPIFQPVQQQQQQPVAPTYTAPMYTGPSFQQLLPTTTGQYDEMKTYVNAAGEERVIPFVNGQPIYPIPAGFTLKEEAAKAVEETPTAVTTKTTRVADRGGRDDNVLVGGITPAQIQQGISERKDRYAITGSRGFDLLQGLPFGNAIKNIFGVEGPVIGKKAPGDITGPKDQLRMEYEKVLGTGITGYVGYKKGDLDPVTGGVFSKYGVATDEKGFATLDSQGNASYSSFGDFKDVLSAGTETGWRGGILSEDRYNNLSPTGKENYDKFKSALDAKQAKQDKPSKDTSKPDTSKPSDTGKDFASNLAGLDFSRDRTRDTGRDNSGNDSGSSSSGKSDSSGIGGCFAKGTMFKMADGTTKAIENIKYGDKMYKGGLVYAIMQGDGTLEDWYSYNNVHVTSGHPVYDNGVWKRVGNTDDKVSINNYDVYYSLMNTNHLMIAENGTAFTDFVEIGADVGDRENWMMQMLNERDAEATAA